MTENKVSKVSNKINYLLEDQLSRMKTLMSDIEVKQKM